MSKTVDERVVEMRFDNKNFEKNVSQSMSTLDKLKRSLQLKDAAKGLEEVDAASKRTNFSVLGNGIETVRAKFSALEVIGVTALANIANSAVNTGKRLISALTIDPIKTGLDEYETKMNAIQVIQANTKGKNTMDEITAALDTLNTYADRTIYSFSQMTSNVGKFVAQGLDVNEATNAIQGMANLAAASGASAEDMSRATYQMSQALGGTIRKIDWNSLRNANMATTTLKDTLMELAKINHIDIDAMISEKGTFEDTLEKGWLSGDLFTQAMNIYSGVYSDAELKAKGFNDEQIKKFQDIAATARSAATEVKTVSQLWAVLKETAQSGWTQSWEYIIGDFETAKKDLTAAQVYFSDMINASSDARNAVLKAWSDAGGRDMAIEALKNTFNGLLSVIKPIKEAFREIFPATTGEQLLNITEKLKDLTSKFKLSDKHALQLKETFKGLFSILDIGKKALGSVGKSIGNLFGSDGAHSFLDLILNATSAIGRFFTKMDEGFDVNGLTGMLSSITSGLSEFADAINKKLLGIGDKLPDFGKGILNVFGWIWDGVKKVVSLIRENVSAGDIFAGLAGGGIFAAFTKLSGLINTVKDGVEGFFNKVQKGGIKEKISRFFDDLHNSLTSFQNGIKVTSLVAIAGAIAILTASVSKLSELSIGDITKSIFAIGVMMAMLSETFKALSKTIKKFDSKGVVKAGLALVLVAASIKILANAMTEIGKLSLKELTKGLIGIGVGLVELSVGLRIISKVKIPLRTSIAMLALAGSCEILASALKSFGSLSWTEIGHGLTAMGGVLGEFVATLSILGKVGGGKSLIGSLSLLIAVQSLGKMADGLKKFGSLSWDEIGRGLVAMGGALLEVTVACGVLGKIAGFSSLFGAGAILMVTQGLDDMANALMLFGSMSWPEIARGLAAMGGAIAEVAVACGVLGKIAGFSSLFGAGAILIVIQGLDDLANALIKFGDMSWDEIGRGLTAMGLALTETGLAAGLTGLAGFSGLLGAASIDIVIAGLDKLANALIKFGDMSWDEIGRGLTAMGGALGEVGLAGALTGLAGIAGILGSGSLYIVIAGLDDLANALIKFGDMSWDEIGRGLTAMGSALGETAIGGLLNTLSGLGALSIKTIAEPLGVLADSMMKWKDVTIPEALGVQLALLAQGVLCFTFDGLGAVSIAAVAEPLGTMADSVRRWRGVILPDNLCSNLSGLSDGIKSFTWAFMGGLSISTVAEPLGALAESVDKWKGVVIPENIGDELSSLSNGIEGFSWLFMAGWSLSTITGPLGDLADTVTKWKDVTISDSVSDGLKSLSEGVEGFSWLFMAGWSLSSLTGPLGDLADTVTKWNGVLIPDGLEDGLSSLASGIKDFSWAFMAGWSLDTITGPLGDLADSIKKWNGIYIPSKLGEQLSSLSTAISDFSVNIQSINAIDVDEMSNVAASITELSGSINGLKAVNIANVDSFVSAVSRIGNIIVDKDALSTASSTLKTSIDDMMTVLTSTISDGEYSVRKAMKTSLSGIDPTIQTTSDAANKSIDTMLGNIIDAITSKQTETTSAFRSLISDAASVIRDKYVSMKSAGKYLGDGLIEGIESKKTSVYNAAFKLGQTAVEGEKDGQKSRSPSKATIQAGKWFGEGLIIGIKQMNKSVYNVANNLGQTAVSSIGNAMARVGEIVDMDTDTQPTIRPILDLSNVSNGVGTLNGMFNSQSVDVMANVRAISSTVGNGQNGNTDIIRELRGLKNSLSGIQGNTYNIDGITYDNGSEVSDAIETLVRATRVGRRV